MTHHCYRVMRLIAFCLIAGAAGVNGLMPHLIADDVEKKEAQERKDRYTKWMRTYSEGTQIKLLNAGDPAAPELVKTPVFRYSDDERAIPDATLWIWTSNARPVALQKVEGNNHGGGQMWTICFASLSEELIKTKWPSGHEFSASEPGVKFLAIPDAETPSDNPRTRSSQIKNLKDRFTARLGISGEDAGGSEARIIPKPIFEYMDPQTKMPLGALFAMSATGTNPDVLLLIEARESQGKLRWEYGHARMTSASVRVRLDDVEVWLAKEGARAGAYDNWMYFFIARPFR